MEMTQFQTTRHLSTTAAPHVLACGFKGFGSIPLNSSATNLTFAIPEDPKRNYKDLFLLFSLYLIFASGKDTEDK